MGSKTIKKLYRDVAPQLRERHLAFLEKHAPRRAEVDGAGFEYLAAGTGSKALVFLPGLLGHAGSLYQQIEEFERDHRVFALTYPDRDEIDVQLDALSAVLEAEGVDRVFLVGQTLGGYLAQAWAWRNPGRVEGLALVHAGLPDPALGQRVASDVRRISLLPSFALRWYLRGVLLHMVDKLRQSGQVEEERARLVAAQFRYRFAHLVDRATILTRYRLISRLHAAPVPEPSDLKFLVRRVLVLFAEGNIFTRDLERLRGHYQGATEIRLGKGHNISLLIKPREANQALREFLDRSPASAPAPENSPSKRGEESDLREEK